MHAFSKYINLKPKNLDILYLVHEAHVIFAITAGSVVLLPEDTSNTSFSYVPVLTWEDGSDNKQSMSVLF